MTVQTSLCWSCRISNYAAGLLLPLFATLPSTAFVPAEYRDGAAQEPLQGLQDLTCIP